MNASSADSVKQCDRSICRLSGCWKNAGRWKRKGVCKRESRLKAGHFYPDCHRAMLLPKWKALL